MERLSAADGSFPQACFTCSARVYIEGGYSCDPDKLDDKSLWLNVARYRPVKCPKKVNEGHDGFSPQTLLRKILGK